MSVTSVQQTPKRYQGAKDQKNKKMSQVAVITAAFRSVHLNEAYIFLQNRYVVNGYKTSKQTSDKILYGPVANSEGLSSLKGTIFDNYGIDCALPSQDDIGKVYLLALDQCILLDYSPYAPKLDTIVKGPMPISEMFPFLKDTVFKEGLDAAFMSSIEHEAYLFKGDQYARINYSAQNGRLMNQGPTRQYWPCLKGTIFESGIGGAFTLHDPSNHVYLFKGEYYARMELAPGTTNDKLVYPVGTIKSDWPELAKLVFSDMI